MSKQLKAHPSWICHWSRVNGSADGKASQIMVWICEYPYRTMHLTAPTDCEDCPIRIQRKALEEVRHPAVA